MTPVDLHGLQGLGCLTTFFTTCCRRISAPASGLPPALPSALTWVSTGLLLSHILTPVFWFNCTKFLSSFLKIHCPRGTAMVTDGPGVFLGPSCPCLCRAQRKLPAASHTSHPCSPPQLLKPGHANPIHMLPVKAGFL